MLLTTFLVKGLASLGKVLDRTLVSFHTRSLRDLGSQANLDLISQYICKPVSL